MPAKAWKLANAFSTLMTPGGKVTLAVAVELASVPANAEALTVVASANCGISFTVTAVPSGIFDAVRVTVTGLLVPVGKDTSAAV